MERLTKDDITRIKVLLASILILAVSLSVLQVNKFQSYSKYERISFESSGATLYANLYFPSNGLSFQNKQPLLIYAHGIGSQRDFDLRVPIEFTKRGFFVASLDYQGHGESEGSLSNINPETGRPALAEDCSKLLDKIEKLPVYQEKINSSQIGLIGHSLGGMTALMNAVLDNRFKATVTWAPLVDPSSIGFNLDPAFEDYIPVNSLNESNPDNLLTIAHVYDEALPFEENALVAHQITGCKLINITAPLIGGGHALLANEVLVESISWFESYFFQSTSVNGPIFITFWINYLLLGLNLLLLLGITLYLIASSARFFDLREENTVENDTPSEKTELSLTNLDFIKMLLKIGVYIGILLNIWNFFAVLFGLFGIFYASLLIIAGYSLIKFVRYYKSTRNGGITINIKEYLKAKIDVRVFLYATLCTVYFLVVYLLFSFHYPFAFVWPSNLPSLILGFSVYPVYISIEIFYRRIIYPNLEFIKDKKMKIRIMGTIALLVHLGLMSLTWQWSFIPAVLATYLIFLVVILNNTVIYEYTQNFASVVESSFIIIQIFFGAVLSTVIGIGPVIIDSLI